MSLPNLFGFVLNMLDNEEALQAEEGRDFCNPIINKWAEVGDRRLRLRLRLRQSGVVQYSPTNQLLIHYLVNDAGRLMYGIS